MNAFEYVSAQNVEEAGELLAANGEATGIIAGGTDLLGEIKQGTVRPSRLVGLQSIDNLRGMLLYEQGLLIGAMTTIAEIAEDEHIRSRYAVLAEACDTVATPQIRNVGTLGGNLCQRPRCWYYRSPIFDCLKKGGDKCFAHEGMNKFHAIFDTGVCPAVHASDTAVALCAVNARVLLLSVDGARMMPVEDFFVRPDEDATVENVMQSGEIVAEIVIPTASPSQRSMYLKAKERQAMDFALASVGLSLEVSEGVVSNARVVLGGVAPVPYRAHDAEEALVGARVGEVDSESIGRLAAEGATPLTDNGYKVRLVSGLVSRAVRTLLHGDSQEGRLL